MCCNFVRIILLKVSGKKIDSLNNVRIDVLLFGCMNVNR